MENKQFVAELSARLHRPDAEAQSLIEALAQVLATQCGQQDTVALPGFGSFVGTKHDETVVTDAATGRRRLLPPEIEITFKSSAQLRRHLPRQ